MNIKGLGTIVFAGIMIAGCSRTVPVAVITSKGETLRGTTTAALTGGSFSATDGKLSCAGDYNPFDHSPTITVPVLCNDGRKGILTATRNESGSGGGGRGRLSDGSEADFIFGDAASRL